MKQTITIWEVCRDEAYMEDGRPISYVDFDYFTDRHKAEEKYDEMKKSSVFFATEPEEVNGSFEGRTFKTIVKETTIDENRYTTVTRRTEVTEEYYKGSVFMREKKMTIDIPLVFDIKDIKQIQFITYDD